MLNSTVKAALWMGATLMVAVGAIAIGNDGYDDTGGSLAKACAGSPPTRQMENALFNARARSDGGADPICAPPEKDDDSGSYLTQQRRLGEMAPSRDRWTVGASR
jgi:hypothetical protein